MKFIALVLSLAALGMVGCASSPPAPLVTGPTVERVEVPYSVPCVNEKDIPAKPKVTRVDPAKGTRTQVSAATLADLAAYEDYAKKQEVLLLSCTSVAAKEATKK